MSVRISGLLLGAALALTASTASLAQEHMTANDVLPGCVSSSRDLRETDAAAAGYCAGTVSALMTLVMSRSLSDVWGCIDIPRGVTVGQGMRVVVRYIEARPQMMHERFVFLALSALRDAWPCK